jgi:hypothetical protein
MTDFIGYYDVTYNLEVICCKNSRWLYTEPCFWTKQVQYMAVAASVAISFIGLASHLLFSY